jgi:hypothetical protein
MSAVFTAVAGARAMAQPVQCREASCHTSKARAIRVRPIAGGTTTRSRPDPELGFAIVADFSDPPIGLDRQDHADGASDRHHDVGRRALTALRCLRDEHPEQAARHGRPADERE